MRNINISMPSQPTIFSDVPEVKKFSCNFVYNFFQSDESVNDSSDINVQITSKLDDKLARYVTFDFVSALQPTTKTNEFKGTADVQNVPNIIEHLDKIYFEHELTTNNFIAIRFQDEGLDDKLYLLTSSSVALDTSNYNKGIKNSFQAEVKKIDQILSKPGISLLDAAKIASVGKNENQAKLLTNSLNNISKLNAKFIDEKKQVITTTNKFEEIKNVGINVKLNNKFAFSILKNALTDPLSIYSDEILQNIRRTLRSQDESISAFDASSIDLAQYDPVVVPVSVRKVDISSFTEVSKIIGYIIDKNEIIDGKLIAHSPIIIQDKRTKYIDPNVAYGRRYVYTIRTIALTEFISNNVGEDDLVAATILLSSLPSNKVTVETLEYIPPPPPADFQITWDHKNNCARLMWSLPVNKQRDIKKFHIFRRQNIYEPFQLIQEYDFDDSFIKFDSGLSVDQQLITRSKTPTTLFLDYEFSKMSKYIYAVTAIDAHGMLSNYSSQIEVSFDQIRNRLNRRIISTAGAPYPYPNMYVNQDDVLVDVIKDSRHHNLSIYFDPEYLNVIDANNNDLKLLSTDKTAGTYCLQLINSDLQKYERINIVLSDKSK